jgi:hypothetical protein
MYFRKRQPPFEEFGYRKPFGESGGELLIRQSHSLLFINTVIFTGTEYYNNVVSGYSAL